MILYHQTSVRLLDSILSTGLVSRKPDAWKGLLDGIVCDGKEVVWFTDNIRPRGSYLHPSKCLVQVDTNLINELMLKKLKVDGWWVYEGGISPQAVKLVDWKLYRFRTPKFWATTLGGKGDGYERA